jgi:hypothetical protein
MTSISDRSSTCPDRVVEQAFRAEWGRLLSLLVSRTRRLDLAEDTLSEAFARASDRGRSRGCRVTLAAGELGPNRSDPVVVGQGLVEPHPGARSLQSDPPAVASARSRPMTCR